ncbi:MAG: LPS assembly lipoprotein LptE [Bdellovibrionales bacterium]|jgi:LPS-assembly lipoprotein
MMTFRPRAFLMGLLLLSACGFSPIYGDHAGSHAVTASMSDVFIESIDGQDGQFLRNKLIDRLYFHGRPAAPKAFLTVVLTSTEVGLGVQKDATTSRSQLEMNASYRLVGKDKKNLFSGTAHSVASYSRLTAQFGTLATQRDAYERALNEIGEQIAGRLSLYYAERERPSATKPAP